MTTLELDILKAGKWDKPYICTDPDAADKLEVQQAFRRIDRFHEQEARMREWRAKQTCGITVLAPDDLIIPCILPANHEGYCNTGR